MFAYESDSDIDTHKAVEAFQVLVDKGEHKDGEYHYGGLSGSTDFDGYTVFLHDSKVSLTVFYRHRYTLECDKEDDLESFKKKINAVINP